MLQRMLTPPIQLQGVWYKHWFVNTYECSVAGETYGSLTVDRTFVGRATLRGQQWLIRPQPFARSQSIFASYLFLVEHVAPEPDDPVVRMENHGVKWNAAPPVVYFKRHSWRTSAWETGHLIPVIQFTEQWWNADIRMTIAPTPDVVEVDLLAVLGIYHIVIERLSSQSVPSTGGG